MPAPELRVGNRVAYFRKAIVTPDFRSESVLARDAFQFAELWLQRNCKSALPFWMQAATYYAAAKTMPPESSPLVSYYCFLNAAKALLIVKGQSFSEKHGVSGEFNMAKRALSNEMVTIQESGIVGALSKYLGEPEVRKTHSLLELLANLPFIHRAYRHTFKSQNEMFIPLRNVVYRRHPTDRYVWFTAEITGKFADKRSLKTLPSVFEVDAGYTDKCVIRSKKRIKWHDHGASKQEKEGAVDRLHSLHKSIRLQVAFISAQLDLWYLKRKVGGVSLVSRYNLTITMAIMHRLSELSRYDPKGLLTHLDGRANWLLTEFIQSAPAQFMDELVCEMTSLELRLPGIRP
jgi:hypothetical protein